MEKLIEILNQFDRERDEKLNEWNEKAVADCFHPLAEKILCNGYFLVNGKYIIDLGAIELYYHEEEGSIKDHVMYHTNEHPNKSAIIRYEEGLPYFKIGSFNLHQSGVDVTFENKDKKYRASFLIRSYRVLTKEESLYNQGIEYDPYSTHLFDDMFYSGLLLSSDNRTTIEWIEPKIKKGGTIEKCPRKNVAMYQENGEKIETTESNYKAAKKEAEENKTYPKCFKYGTKYYMQDMRPWQFRLKGIKEKK